MGIFRQFPYSNFHEMNMDEIIKIIKNMLEEWATYHAEWDQWMADLEASWTEYQDDVNAQWAAYQNTMNTAWQSMQDFINNYFDNLDVQEEINNKIVSMIQTGEFGLLVNEYIPPAVNAWLNLNITQPTGVVIDTSLSVAGACADAKATGDAVNDLQSDLTFIGDRVQLFDGEVYIPSSYWELGNIEYNDGSYTASTTRLRTKQNKNTYLEAGTIIKLSNYEDIRLGWARFDESGVFQQSLFWIPGDYQITTSGYYGFVLQNIPPDPITTEFSVLTDKLSIYGLINEKNTIDGINDDYTMYANGYEYGTFGPATGAESPSTTRIRTKYIPVRKGAKISTKHYKIVMYYYDEGKVYDPNESITAWVRQGTITVDADGYIRIAASLINDADISDEDALLIAKDVSIYPCVSPTYSINKLEQKVEELEVDIIPTIPDYFESNLESAESTIITNMNLTGVEGETFIFATDFHWSQNAKTADKLIKRLCYDNPRVNKLICGGDYIDGSDNKATELETVYECVNAFVKAQPNIYMMYGNHDKNTIGSTSPDNYFSEAESYSAIQAVMKDVDYGSYFYFYKDDVQTKTRMIFLDTGVYSTSDILSDAQKTWLNSTLASVPTGWHIIVFAHVIYNADDWYVVPLVLSLSPLMTEVCTILDSFNALNNGSKVEAIIGGHAHCDYDNTTSGGIPIVLTDTCSLEALNGGTATTGSITETAFDVITVDYANEVVRCARVGRGSNRNISY